MKLWGMNELKMPQFSQDWDSQVNARLLREDGVYFCTDCDYSSSKKPNTVSHIQARHITGFEGYTCSACGSNCGTIRAFDTHLNRVHGTNIAKHFNMLDNFVAQGVH